MIPSYWCVWCMKEIVPKPENGGYVFTHERVDHPDDFDQNDEIWEN